MYLTALAIALPVLVGARVLGLLTPAIVVTVVALGLNIAGRGRAGGRASGGGRWLGGSRRSVATRGSGRDRGSRRSGRNRGSRVGRERGRECVMVLTLLDREGENRADNGQSSEEVLHLEGGLFDL